MHLLQARATADDLNTMLSSLSQYNLLGLSGVPTLSTSPLQQEKQQDPKVYMANYHNPQHQHHQASLPHQAAY